MRLCTIILFIFILSFSTFGQSQNSDLAAPVPKDWLAQEYTQKLDSIESSFHASFDSLQGANNCKLSRLDSARSSLRNNLDCLSSLKLPIAKIEHVLDSIGQLREKTIVSLNKQIQSLKVKTTGRLNALNLPPELGDKLSSLTDNVNNFSIPSADINLTSINLPVSPLGKLADPSLESSISEIGNIGDLGNIPTNVSGIPGDVSGLSADVNELTEGNLEDTKALPRIAEEKVAEVSGLSDLEDQAGITDKYKSDVSQLQDPEALKEGAGERIQQAAMDHFAGKGQILQEAMETMEKYKKKYESVSDISALPKKLPNAMRGRPFVERLVPGIGFQIQKEGDNLLVDFNPYLGYRFTGRITGGMGWNQRVAYNTKGNNFDAGARIYGPRAYGEVDLWKGFCPRAEVEVMNAFVPPFTKPATIDQGTRQWVWGVFVGMKKEYRFLKVVKGTAAVMLRVFDPQHKSPYGDMVNARIGFEFPLRKNTKQIRGN